MYLVTTVLSAYLPLYGEEGRPLLFERAPQAEDASDGADMRLLRQQDRVVQASLRSGRR